MSNNNPSSPVNNDPSSPVNNDPSSPVNNTNNQVNTNQSNTLILNLTLDQKVDTVNTHVTNQQGQSADGSEVTESKMTTTDPNATPQITENLVGKVDSTYYNNDSNIATSTVLDEIKLYASKIQCSDFHGKGTIDDYTGLFQAASRIASETKQMQLDVDIDGFNDFGKAADDLSALFNSFIVKLQNVSIIDDSSFLRSVADALQKIYNLSEVFGRFKKTIMATTTVKLPKSAYDTSVILQGVMSEVNCAMGYIGHFVNPGNENLPEANLSAADRNIINTAISTIDNWNTLCDQGVNIAMTNNTNIQSIKQINNELKVKSATIANATNLLKNKLALFNITN
jgi:hypothetical protein